jgi:hypothetical protein
MGENDAKSLMTMVYGDFGGPGQRKNKANLPDISMELSLSGSRYVESAGRWLKLR